ncbi:hypothetical protein [Verrucosispora sp. WMMD573]|uniref:hypothetical protein n=1 Tax=Verrucosispora sp. WMMD573 TaxID=3015149 RepID=UPI00248B57BC|nr:hypothetical protein [Verrucosispora sp. WMMD573]WBB56169.1 hypothetical protein O7601_08935 [Verrucosispora sp. WMMD573]
MIAAVLLLILLLIVALAWALSRTPETLDGAGGEETSSTPSSSASSVALPTPSISSDPAPTSASESPIGDEAPTGSTSGLPVFGTSNVPARSNGVVRLDLNGYGIEVDSAGQWASARNRGGDPDGEDSDITFTDSGVAGREGIQFALLAGVERPNFDTCKAQRGWTPSLTWNEAKRGAFVCIRTSEGRRGLMRIDEAPDLDAGNAGDTEPSTQVTGILWTPIVDE